MHFRLPWPVLVTITALLCAQSSIAAPQPHRERKNGDRKASHEKKGDLSSITVPLSNGSASLPPPEGTLKTIALGLGTQNYTCNATTPAPVLLGAKATLTDITPLLPFISLSDKGFDLLCKLPALTFKIEAIIDIINRSLGIKLDITGHHIFNALGTPEFDFGDSGLMVAKKIPGADLVAPGDAIEGSVNWLKLGDAGGSKGFSQVYRVDTAGGKAPATCEGQGEMISVPYAALYWFYE